MTEAEWLTCDNALTMLRFAMAGPPGLEGSEGGLGCAYRPGDRKLLLMAAAALRAERSLASTDPAHLEAWAETGACPFAGGICRPTLGGSPPQPMTPYDILCESLFAAGCRWAVPRVLPYAAVVRDVLGNPFRPAYWPDDPKKHAEPRFSGEAWRSHPRDVPHVEARRAWLTPLVTSLATAAYEERRTVTRHACNGQGKHSHRGLAGAMAHGVFHAGNPMVPHHHHDEKCARVVETDGTLDPVRLAVLADALEEAGCVGGLIEHLRSPGPHYRGCWALDLILGRG